MFRDALNETAIWSKGKYPYDYAHCGHCMTQHVRKGNGCSPRWQHAEFVTAVREVLKSAGVKPFTNPSVIGRWRYGRSLLKAKPELLRLREKFNSLYPQLPLVLEFSLEPSAPEPTEDPTPLTPPPASAPQPVEQPVEELVGA